MRSFLIILFSLIDVACFAQSKQCDFPLDSAKNFTDQNVPLLIDSLQAAHLETRNKKSYIPKFIKRNLNCWTKKFDIANPNKSYQSADVVSWRLKPLPLRQLTYLGLSDHYLILTYKKGGYVSSDYILIFKFYNKKVIDVWAGGNIRLTSKDEVVYFLRNYQNYFPLNYRDL
jgi:hypothetical protein